MIAYINRYLLAVMPHSMRHLDNMHEEFYVYILASKRNGTLYVGMTSDLLRRIQEHSEGTYKTAFSYKYFVNTLVYYEAYGDPISAIQRKKLLKKWRRAWKLSLIERDNPEWKDLADEL